MEGVAEVLESGRGRSVRAACHDPGCPLRWAVIAPSPPTTASSARSWPTVPGSPPCSPGPRPSWPAGCPMQLELAELDRSRTRLMEAEIRALRAQISPHFVYNSLAAIASFVRTDPERARELLLEFADFTRYSSAGTASSPSSPTNCGPSSSTSPWPGPASGTGSRSPCRSRRRCCRSACPSCASSRSWRTPSSTVWRTPAPPAGSPSPRGTRAPSGRHHRGRRRRHGPRRPAGRPRGRAPPVLGDRPAQRRRAAAPGVRRRLLGLVAETGIGAGA